MKKHGFSLAELLVALGIIAVGASLMVPVFLNARPDRYKFRVINCYNLANEATEALLSNPALYFPQNPDDTCIGLNCTGLPLNSNPTGITLPAGTTSDCKYPLLMKELLRLGNASTTCNNGKLAGDAPDKIRWNFEGSVSGGYNITITFPRTSPGNCQYNATSCKNPNQFVFHVDSRGDIVGQDALTRVYLRNLTNIHKQDDFAELNGQ